MMNPLYRRTRDDGSAFVYEPIYSLVTIERDGAFTGYIGFIEQGVLHIHEQVQAELSANDLRHLAELVEALNETGKKERRPKMMKFEKSQISVHGTATLLRCKLGPWWRDHFSLILSRAKTRELVILRYADLTEAQSDMDSFVREGLMSERTPAVFVDMQKAEIKREA